MSYLEKIMFLKFFEHWAFNFNKIIWHHNEQQNFVMIIEGHI